MTYQLRGVRTETLCWTCLSPVLPPIPNLLMLHTSLSLSLSLSLSRARARARTSLESVFHPLQE